VRDVPMPRDLSEEKVAEWLHDDYEKSARVVGWKTQEACRVPWKDLPAANQAVMLLTARAVRALVEATGEKVARQAYHAGYSACVAGIDVTTRIDADVYFILARVLGDHPKGGHEAEGREAPRG